jgi:hypothetical protein
MPNTLTDNTDLEDLVKRCFADTEMEQEFDPELTLFDTQDTIKRLVALITAGNQQAERRGEVATLKRLKHWMTLHNRDADVGDIDHLLISLEQFPDQPTASQTLEALSNTQEDK